MVSKIAEHINQLKITRLLTDLTDPNEILAQLMDQNIWLRNLSIQIDRIYTIKTPKIEYTNAIINCDIDTHRQILERGRLLFGLSECRIYEQVNILQCLKCQRFGHFARECTFAASCKICAQDHETKNCTAEQSKYTCHNCVLENKRNGTKLNTRHTSSDDRCPMRK